MTATPATVQIKAAELRVWDRLLVPGTRTRRARVETVSSVIRTPACEPMPAAVYVEVRGGWSQEQYAPEDLVEVVR